MSNYNLQQELTKHILATLNVKIESVITLETIENKLTSLKNVAAFVEYAEMNFKKSKYAYDTGYQKFLTVFNDYKKTELTAINDDNLNKANSQSELLFNAATDCFEFVRSLINNGRKLEDERIGRTINKFFSVPQLKLLASIGDRKEIYRLAVYDKYKFQQIIQKKIFNQYIKVLNPSNQIVGPGMNLSLEDLKMKASRV